MKKFIFTILLMLMPVMHVMGIVYYTYVDGLYYDFKSDGTAAVSSHIKYGRGEYSQDYSGDVVIPPTVTYNKRTYRVTSINEGAFSHCSDLNSVTIPNSITYIGYEAFYWHSLNSIYITDLAAWCNIKHEQSGLSYSHLFLNGEEVKDLIIPNGVTSISDWAFSCSGLTYVSIPNSVTSIGSFAFSSCSGLSTIKSEIENPFVLDTRVFSDVYARATLIVPKGKKSAYNSTEGWKKFKYIVEEGEFVVDDIYYKIDENNTASVISGNREYSGDIVIPAYVNYDGKTYNVTSIGEWAFYDCSGLTSVTIPNSVTSICSYAFNGCSGLTSVHISDIKAWCGIKFYSNPLEYAHHLYLNGEEIKDLVVPNSVSSIGDRAFRDCSGLTSVTIPNSVTFIGDAAFSDCSDLVSIKVESGNIKYDSRNDCNAIIEKSSQTLIAGCKNTIIPNSVTSIGYAAFSGCIGLTSVSIPNSVTSIGRSAFSGCSGLASITITNSVTSIGQFAFNGCSGLTSITIPRSVTSIGERIFEYCSGLTSIKVESGNQFYDSRNDCNAIIETSSNTLIAGCKSTIIPISVTSVGNHSFRSRSTLTSIAIPNSVTSIGGYAFRNCSGLTSVTIPNSVTSIGSSAFRYCSSLTTIVSKIDNPYEIDIDLFYSDLNDIYSTATLYVPAGKKAAYESTVGWKKFNNIKEIIDGDVNLDEKVNRIDQNTLVAHIMGEKPEGFYEGLADLNGDDDVNAADVVKLVDILNSVGLSTDSQVDFDNVDGNLVVSALTCTLNNERDEAILLKECELFLNGNLVSSRTFSGSSANVAAGANKSCSFGNLTRFATRTGFSVLWHYTVNGEAFVYRCPLTD